LLLGLVDTGASIMTLDKEFIKEYDIKPESKSMILTANSIIEAPIYKNCFRYENQII
jgi:predicted aspartyl protease